MKILYFTAYPHVVGGSQLQLAHLLDNTPTDLEPIVLTTDKGVVVEHFQAQKKTIHVLKTPPVLSIFNKALLQFSFLKVVFLLIPAYLSYSYQLVRFLRSVRPDGIHCTDERAVLLMGIAKFLTQTPLIWYVQTEPKIGRFFWNCCTKIANHIVCNGRYAMQYFGKQTHKTRLIYTNSLLSNKHRQPILWLETLQRNNIPIVGCVANISRPKGTDVLVRAMTNCTSDCVVLIIGREVPEYRVFAQQLRTEIQDKGAEHITFTGWVNKPSSLMQYFDMLVMPSLTEGLPTVILEGMELAKPIVATNVGGVKELVIDGETGFVIPPNDEDLLCEKITYLLNQEVVRKKMGQAAKQHFIKHFASDVATQQFIDLYEELG